MTTTPTPDTKLFALDGLGSNLVTLGFGADQAARFLAMSSNIASFLRKKANKDSRGLELGAYLLHAIQPANRDAFAAAAPALPELAQDMEAYLVQNAIGLGKGMGTGTISAATMLCNAMRSYLSITPDLPAKTDAAPPAEGDEALPELQN